MIRHDNKYCFHTQNNVMQYNKASSLKIRGISLLSNFYLVTFALTSAMMNRIRYIRIAEVECRVEYQALTDANNSDIAY